MADIDEILSVPDIKAQLRIPGVDDLQDALLIDLRREALSEVAMIAHMELLDRSVTKCVEVPDSVEGYAAFDVDLDAPPTQVLSAEWSDRLTGETTAVADGTVVPLAAAIEPRRVDRWRRGLYRIRRTADGGLWPGWRSGFWLLRVYIELAMPMDLIPAPVPQAAILLIRGHYFGDPESLGKARIEAGEMLKPYMRPERICSAEMQHGNKTL